MALITDMKRLASVRPVVLDDHTRLPSRFFGRFTACAAAGLR